MGDRGPVVLPEARFFLVAWESRSWKDERSLGVGMGGLTSLPSSSSGSEMWPIDQCIGAVLGHPSKKKLR